MNKIREIVKKLYYDGYLAGQQICDQEDTDNPEDIEKALQDILSALLEDEEVPKDEPEFGGTYADVQIAIGKNLANQDWRTYLKKVISGEA